MSSITKLLSENIIMSPPNNNNKNMIYHGSVSPSFVSASIDTIDEKKKATVDEESNKKQASHLLSCNLHVRDSSTTLYKDLLASTEIFDTCQNRSASVEVCKTAALNKPHGEPPNKPHDWPPFILKNNRQSE